MINNEIPLSQSVRIQPKNKIVITVIGESGVGKTSFLNSLIFSSNTVNQRQVPTLGLDIRYWRVNNDLLIKFYEVGEFTLKNNGELFENLSEVSSYIFYVIDYSNPNSVDYINDFKKYFAKNKLVVIFNKDDRQKLLSEQSDSFFKFKNGYSIEKIISTNCYNKDIIDKVKLEIEEIIKKGLDGQNDEELNKKQSLFDKDVDAQYSRPEPKKKNIGCF